MKITAVDTVLVEVPLKPPVAPYRTRYRASSTTQSLLVRLKTDTGITGWGETPQRYLGPQLTGDEARQLQHLVGRDPTAIEPMYADWGLDGQYVQSAVEMAMWDVLGQLCGQPLWRLIGGRCRDAVPLAACMGIRAPEEAAQIARQYVAMGLTTLKIKAGRDPAEDLAIVRAIRDAVGHRLQLRVDPNMAYAPDVALQLARDLEPYRVEYLEQPMPAELIDQSARLRHLTATPLALNESVTDLASVRRIVERDAAAVLLPDTYQCGGIWAVKQVAALADSAGIACVMHCSHDLGLKTAAMLHVAASTPAFSLPNDCTYYGLIDDVITQPFQMAGGQLPVPDAPGLGVQVDLQRLRRYARSSLPAD